MKKRIALLLVALMVVAVFPGMAAKADSEPVKLAFWIGWSGQEEAYLRGVLDKYTEKTGVEVETLIVSDSAKIVTAIAGGTPPDLVDLPSLGSLTPIIENGCALDLVPYMERDGITWDLFLPACEEAFVQPDGAVYGLPFLSFNDGLFWNKAMLQEAGLDAKNGPATLEELAEYAKALTVLADDGSIERLGFYPNDRFEYFLPLFGGEVYDDEIGAFVLDSDAAANCIEWMRSINADLDPQAVISFFKSLGADLTPDGGFESGKLAMESNGCWKVAFNTMNVPDLEYGTAAMPPSETCPEAANFNYVGFNPHFIPVGCEHEEEAWQLLKAICCDPMVACEFGEFCANLTHMREVPAEFEGELFKNPNFITFIDMANSDNAHTSPVYPSQNEAVAMIGQVVEELMRDPSLDAHETLTTLNDDLNAMIG